MSKTNEVRLIGYLGKDPEVINTSSGGTICRFSLSTTEKWKDKSGVSHESTQWHVVMCFEGLAKLVQSSLKKGAQVMVLGRVQYRQYENKSGETRYSTDIICEDILFLGRAKS